MSASSSVHLFLRLGIVHILIHDVLHLCWMPRVWGVQKQQKKTRHLKDDLSHILYECFSQHVAGSLTWITTAVSTAPSPSLSFCSSKVPILFPLTLPFKFSQEEKTSLVFLYDLKKKKRRCNPGWQSLSRSTQICQRDISKPCWLKKKWQTP